MYFYPSVSIQVRNPPQKKKSPLFLCMVFLCCYRYYYFFSYYFKCHLQQAGSSHSHSLHFQHAVFKPSRALSLAVFLLPTPVYLGFLTLLPLEVLGNSFCSFLLLVIIFFLIPSSSKLICFPRRPLHHQHTQPTPQTGRKQNS